MKKEHVILVDEQGKTLGILEKILAHTENTPLHLAFSSWLFNTEGKCLVTRRAISKKSWPGVWTNSVCGHQQSGETSRQAIIRRCRYEIGAEITDITTIIPQFRYKETDPLGIIENEFCPVYAAKITNTIAINKDEVIDYQWIKLETLLIALEATPWVFSPWMVSEAILAKVQLSRFAIKVNNKLNMT